MNIYTPDGKFYLILVQGYQAIYQESYKWNNAKWLQASLQILEAMYRGSNNLTIFEYWADEQAYLMAYQSFVEAMKDFKYSTGSAQLLGTLNQICLTIEDLIVKNKGGLVGDWWNLQQTRIRNNNSSTISVTYGIPGIPNIPSIPNMPRQPRQPRQPRSPYF